MLSICDAADFTPINEAVIIKQFMESLLGRTSPSGAYSITYNFRIKDLWRSDNTLNALNRMLLQSDEGLEMEPLNTPDSILAL